MDVAQMTHSNLLLQRHRCGWCAESTSAVRILREEPCECCNRTLVWRRSEASSSLGQELRRRWIQRRWAILLAVLLLSMLGGQIPMLQSLLMVATMIFLHVWLIRKPLKWFPPARRVCAGLNVKILLASIAIFTLFVNVLIWPFACANGLILSALGVGGVLMHVQGGFMIIERRLQWEVQKRPFGIHDWLVPVTLLVVLFAVTFLGMISMVVAWEWMMSVPVPWTEMNVREFMFG